MLMRAWYYFRACALEGSTCHTGIEHDPSWSSWLPGFLIWQMKPICKYKYIISSYVIVQHHQRNNTYSSF
uniref:Pco148683 n=1 Tax=Arundo donax TaxID=35708 RepID=A0A0A9D8G0_ARUDO